MTPRRTSLCTLLIAFAATACSPYNGICCGYEWWDGGPDNIALVRNVNGERQRVVQPHVSAFGVVNRQLFAERRPEPGLPCEYYIVSMDTNRVQRFGSVESFQAAISGTEISEALPRRFAGGCLGS